MLIRSFHKRDTEAVVALWDACSLTRPWNNPHLDIERKSALNDDLFLVLLFEGRLAATVMGGYDGHRGWVNYLAVDPGIRRKGLGKALMDALEERLLARGCPKINLQVRRENTSVVDFYESLGFAEDQCISLGKRLIADD